MSDDTGIEWADSTWNPTTGCDRVSPGCDNCYAMTLAPRLKAMGSAKYQRDGDPRTSGPGFGLSIHPSTLDQPLRWTRPRRIFVNSMSDLFHDQVPDDFIARVFAVMACAPVHTFQILTKRHGRMRSLLNSQTFYRSVRDILRNDYGWTEVDAYGTVLFPLPNVWLGVSVEDQKRTNLRVPALMETPAAVRFLSCEPLLGSVSLFANSTIDTGILPDWVIVGGESGPGARPMLPQWARGLRDECTNYGIAFHFKQWGSHDEHGNPVHKKIAGRLLDGRTWDEFPEVTR